MQEIHKADDGRKTLRHLQKTTSCRLICSY